MHSRLRFILFTLFLLCAIWCPHQNYAQTISPGTVAFDGMRIESEVTDGTKYVGKREIRSSDLKIASEEWTETLPSGTVNNRVKPPESEVYTFSVNARGQGKIDLSVDPNGAATFDVGAFRETDVQPTSLTTNERFTVNSRGLCSVIRTYEVGYIPSYYDTCIPIANEGYQSEVLAGTESLDADASVTPWDISVVYGTENQITKTLGFSGGWPPNVGVDAGWGETNTQKWGWKLEEKTSKTKRSKTGSKTFPPLSGSFSVALTDTKVSDSNDGVPVVFCVNCPNCEGSVNTVDDHVRKVIDANGNAVLAICRLGAGGESPGCGKKIYDCTPEETARQNAWHMERTCTNDSVFAPGQLSRIGDSVCRKKFRHCTQSNCWFRYKIGKGHSDGSVSQAPDGITNAYADSHNLETPPDEDDDGSSELVSNPSSPGLYPVNASYITINGEEMVDTAPGDTVSVDLVLPSDKGYSQIYWYLAGPNDSGYGNGVGGATSPSGNGIETEVTHTFSMPSGASGVYTFTAYIYPHSSASDQTVYEYQIKIYCS